MSGLLYTPFGDTYSPDYDPFDSVDYLGTYAGNDAVDKSQIDPKTCLLKVDLEDTRAFYQRFLEMNITPGSLVGNVGVVMAGAPPKHILSFLPFLARKGARLRLSDVGQRNVLHVIHAIGNGGDAAHIYRTTTVEEDEIRTVDTRLPLWEKFAYAYQEIGEEIFAGVEGADLSHFDAKSQLFRYVKDTEITFQNIKKPSRRKYKAMMMTYGFESAARNISELRAMLTRFFSMLEPAKTVDPLRSGELVHPFVIILAKGSDEYHSGEGTHHPAYSLNEASMREEMKPFEKRVCFEIDDIPWGYREGEDGSLVVTGYALCT